MLTNNFDLRPSLADDPGPVFHFPERKQTRLLASVRVASTSDEPEFDDTFQEQPVTRERRLREAHPWNFSRGVPTNGKTSSKNYSDDNTKIIDGEHKTLLVLGKINEAMEGDDHDSHIQKHRLQLADPNVTETQRAGLIEHISDHVKKRGKKLKAIQKEAKGQGDRPDITKNRGYGHGVGMLSKALPAKTYDVIPQDQKVDTERKKTAGMVSMESRVKGFNSAVRNAYGRRSL